MTYDYRGFEIRCPDFSDNCTVENFHTGFSQEFESFDAACDWIDEQMDDEEELEEVEEDEVIHNYLFFFVDNATDRPDQAYIRARNYDEAVDILYEEYDVYQIADYTILD